MAQTKVKKKAAAAPKRPVSKAAPKKKVVPKPVGKKTAAKKVVNSKSVKKAVKPAAKVVVKATSSKAGAKKVVAKPAAKVVVRAKPAAKPSVGKAVPEKSKNAKSAKSAVVASAKPAAKRPVAVSHRPQAAAVAVQARPAAKPPVAARGKSHDVGTPGVPLTEDQIRRAPESAYMNDAQMAFFQERLLQMRAEVLTRELDVKERLHQREVFADPADRASAEEEHWLDLRLRERESLLLKKIDDALRRIRDRDYGYCEKTGEAIGIARLLARPTATVCVDIKGQTERAESQYRDR